MKKIFTLMMSLIIAIVGTVMFTASATVSACTVSYIEYDLNGDDVLDNKDLSLIEEQMLSEKPVFTVADAVKLKKLISENNQDYRVVVVNTETPDEFDINRATNAINNCELTVVEYENGTFYMHDLIGCSKMDIPETTAEYDELLAEVEVKDGSYVSIGLEKGKIRAHKKANEPNDSVSIGKAAMFLFIDENYKVSESRTEELKAIFKEDALVNAEKNMLFFENETTEIYIKFSTNYVYDQNNIKILATAEFGDMWYELVTDGNVYCIFAVA